MEVVLDGFQRAVYDRVDIARWGVFENYFKVGNYLGTTNENAFSKVTYYDLEVSH